jgi:hypothetical protein
MRIKNMSYLSDCIMRTNMYNTRLEDKMGPFDERINDLKKEVKILYNICRSSLAFLCRIEAGTCKPEEITKYLNSVKDVPGFQFITPWRDRLAQVNESRKEGTESCQKK